MAIEKLTEFAKTGQKDTDQLDLEVGFIVNRKPARQWFNWLFNTLTTKINEIIDADFMPKSDVVDNLTTDDSEKPVSAKQAKLLKDQIQSIEDIILYAPIAWAKSTAPTGYLVMMGQSISQAAYPKLYALYGSKLPDLRAYTIRGLDHGRGIDTGRTVLSEQGDAIRDIQGSLYASVLDSAGPSGAFTTTIDTGGFAMGTIVKKNLHFKASNVVPTANENRVKNIAFLYIVKAG